MEETDVEYTEHSRYVKGKYLCFAGMPPPGADIWDQSVLMKTSYVNLHEFGSLGLSMCVLAV